MGQFRLLMESRRSPAIFATTHRSVVLDAGSGTRPGEAPETRCRAHWRPLHAFLVRKGTDRVTGSASAQ
jgi:hypothetical protein